MVDIRNLTTHGYDEELIEKIIKEIPSCTTLLDTILQRTKTNKFLESSSNSVG